MFRCNLTPALLVEWLGSFTCHCGNTGVNRTPSESAHKVDSGEKKFSRRSCQDSNSQYLDHESGALTNKLSGRVGFRFRQHDKRDLKTDVQRKELKRPLEVLQ